MASGETDQGAIAHRSAIAMLDAMGWGAFLVWMGVVLVANVGSGVALIGVGAIALGVQLARRLSALPVDRGGLGLGGCLLVVGLLQWFDLFSGRAALSAWVFPGALVIIGLSTMISAWSRRKT
jgi:hypothetical protein